MYHVPSTEFTAQGFDTTAPNVNGVSAAPVLPALSYQQVGPLESSSQLLAAAPSGVPSWNLYLRRPVMRRATYQLASFSQAQGKKHQLVQT